MESYKLTKAANMMVLEATKGKTKYQTLIATLTEYSIVRRGNVYDGFYKNKKILLNEQFKYEYPKETELYFEEYYTEQGFYQLKITEVGVKELYKFIIRELGKGLF